jgi:hypothetical protein
MMTVLLAASCSAGGSEDSDDDSRDDRPASNVTTAPAGPSALPSARTEVAGAVWQGRIVVAGGLTEAGVASDRVDLYDPLTNRWDPGPPLPIGLHHVGLAAVGDRVYLAGGHHNPAPAAAWEPQSRVLSLGPGERSWREEPPLAQARGGLALAAVGDRLVAMGGTTAAGDVLRTTEVLAAGAAGGAWRPGPDLTEPRDHLAAASSGGRVYAIAGRQGSLESNLATVESWDGVSEGWQPEPPLNDTRGGMSAAEVSGRPCVAGGEEPRGTIASVECLVDGRWDRVATLEVPRHGLAVVGFVDGLHVIGGGPQPGLFVSTAHEVVPIA